MEFAMLKQVSASLLLVIISSGWCMGAGGEYMPEAWGTYIEVDDLTDEATVYKVRLRHSKKQRPVGFYTLTISCNMKTKEMGVEVGGGSSSLLEVISIVGVDLRMSKEATVEYRLNQESVLTEVWEITNADHVFFFKSLYPAGFAHELLRVMEEDKPQFRFREIGRKVLHFDLRGGAPFVRAVLGKCDALTEKVE